MREILFKAKIKDDTTEWVEGHFCKCDNVFTISDNSGIGIFINPDTLCQYTGLTDKNGNKIWENDIVKHYNNPSEPKQFVKGVIYWNEENVRFERSDDSYAHAKYSVFSDSVYEVIGNIFDNPELLGK